MTQINIAEGGAVAVSKPWKGGPPVGTEITTAPVISLYELLEIIGVPLILEKLSKKYDRPIAKVKFVDVESISDITITYDGYNVCVVNIRKDMGFLE